MKFISWNVNGLRAVAGKNFSEVFTKLDADFFCIQETKMQHGQLDLSFDGYFSYWNYAEKKGYSGTAIYTKHEPVKVSYGMGIPEHDTEGRLITLEYPDFYIITVYTPNSQDGLKRLDYRVNWEDCFRDYVCSLKNKKHVIICGDMNVAHEEIDLKNPSTNHMNAGFSDREREKFSELLNSGFTDTFRYFYPDRKDIYSWWSYRFRAREKNAGWRIDYFVVSDSLNSKLTSAKIHTDIEGSDHCPVELDVDFTVSGFSPEEQKLINEVSTDEISVAVLSPTGEINTAVGHTILPLIELIDSSPSFFKEGFVSDKVIGKGAASLLVKAGIKSAYGKLMSKDGKKLLEENGIVCSYETLCETILNRKGNGMCPVESLVLDENDTDKCVSLVREFASNIKQ